MTPTQQALASDARAIRWAVNAHLAMQEASRALAKVTAGRPPTLDEANEAARVADVLARLGRMPT